MARPIGKGKFAIVYRAKRKKDGKTVALKNVSLSNMDDKSMTKCMREVCLLQSLDHRNIIRYQESFLDNNKLVIVLEWAAAGDLNRQVRKALEHEVHFEERIIWRYFSQICGAISYMHKMRIMHRDIKPANIFLTLKGQVKVGDLGLGRVMSTEDDLAYSKVGTPLYVSIEVLGGGGYSWKSDVWSLGCVLYELAMLRSPFKSENLDRNSLYKKISTGNYPPMLVYYSEELRALATGMINTNPCERPSVEKAHSIALGMKRKMDAMGNPATPPPETARHLKLKNPTPRTAAAANTKTAATATATATTAADNLPPSRGAATSVDECRGGADTTTITTTKTTATATATATATTAADKPAPSRGAATSGDERRGDADPRSNGQAIVVLDAGTSAALAEGAMAVPPSIDHIGAVVAAAFATVRTRTSSHDLNPKRDGEAATACTLAHRLGGCTNNDGDDNHHNHHQQQHHHRHQNNRHHCYHHDKMDSNSSGSHSRRGRPERVESNHWEHHHEHLKVVLQQQQPQQWHVIVGESQPAGNSPDRRDSNGIKDGKRTVGEAAVSIHAKRWEGGTTAATTIEKKQPKRTNSPATSTSTASAALKSTTSAMHARADVTKNRHKHSPKQHPKVLAAHWFEISQTATPQPLPAGTVVAASGIALPRVRAGSFEAKSKAALAAAAAMAGARDGEGGRRTGSRWSSSPPPQQKQVRLGPTVVRFNDAIPSKVNGADPRWGESQAVDVRAKGEPAAQAPAWEGPTRSNKQEQRPPRMTTREAEDTNCRAPVALSVAADAVARRSTLPTVAVARRASATSVKNSKSNSGTTATSSPSSSSTLSARDRGEEQRYERKSNTSGEGRGGGGAGSRHDDIEMMMAAESKGDRDDKECGNRRRTQERQERSKKTSNHNSKRRSTHHQPEAEPNSDSSNSASSFSVPSSRSLPPAETAACVSVERKVDVGTETRETETAALSGRKARGQKQWRWRRGSSAADSAIANATGATTAEVAVDVDAITGAEASTTASAAATATPARGGQAVAASATRIVTVSGDNFVAMKTLSGRLSILGYEKALRRRTKPSLARLHFAVPGADSDGGVDGEGDGDRASDWPMRFPSRKDQFLDFVSLSKWLLEQLSGGGGFTLAATGAPVTECAGILQACQRLGFEPSQPREVGGAVGTESPFLSAPTPSPATISPINLAVGSGTAVLELLGWLSHAVLNKVKTTLSRGVGDREDERKWGGEVHEANRLTDCSDERGMQDEEGGVVVRPGERRVGATKGKPGETAIASRTRGGNGSIGRHGRSDSASSNNYTAAGRRRHRVIHRSTNGRYVEGKGNERTGEKASVAVIAAGARGNNNSGCSAGDNARRCRALPPELASMMVTTAAVSSVGGYTSCWCSSSCSARCSCCASQFGSSMDDGHGGGGGGSELEDDEAVWGRESSVDGLAFMGSMIEPTVDPAAWRAEQERVAPRLARAAPPAGSPGCGTDSWAARVEVFRKAAGVISSATAGGDSPPQVAAAAAAVCSKLSSHGNGYGDGYSRSGGRRESRRQTSHAEDKTSASDVSASEDRKDCLESMLVRHRGEVLQHLKAVAAGERRVNSLYGGGSTGGRSGNLPCFREEALLLRDQERALLEELEERKARVAALTIELRHAEAAVDETEVAVREAAADCSDPTKLHKTKSAIRQLKADVKAIDVIIGVKSATLLGKQQGVQRAAREAEHTTPVGSRWGGLNSRSSRGGGGGSGGGGGARTTFSLSSTSISLASVADTPSTVAPTNTASSAMNGSGMVKLAGKWTSSAEFCEAKGSRLGRGRVLIHGSMEVWPTGSVRPTAKSEGRPGAEARAGGSRRDQ